MKENDYFLTSDWEKLTVNERQQFAAYCNLMGIVPYFCRYQEKHYTHVVLDCDVNKILVYTSELDPDLNRRVLFEDLKRMSSLGDFSNENA